MKKQIKLINLYLLLLILLMGCSKKPVEKIIVNNNANTNIQNNQQINQETTTEETSVDPLEGVDINSLILLTENDETGIEQYEEVDYSNCEFEELENIFIIKSIKTLIKRNKTNDLLIIGKELRGKINGYNGIFSIRVPYDSDYKIDEELEIIYKKAYNMERGWPH